MKTYRYPTICYSGFIEASMAYRAFGYHITWNYFVMLRNQGLSLADIIELARLRAIR